MLSRASALRIAPKLELYGASSTAALACYEARRWVQFRKTSEMNNALNSGKASTQKWVTKSTADYAAKTELALEAGVIGGSVERKRNAKARQIAVDRKNEELQAWSESQVARMAEFQAGRRRRYASHSARYGWTFLLVYIILYVVMLGVIWLILRLGLLDMLSFFEFVYCLLSGHLDRPQFFERLEEWGDYTNLGFAFLLNEMLDIIRVPLTLAFWWMFRRALIRVKTSTVFRWNAPEYDFELRRVQRTCEEAGRKAEETMRLKELVKVQAAAAPRKTPN
jgi:hypothetical protein